MTLTHANLTDLTFAAIPAIVMGGMVPGRRLATYACFCRVWKDEPGSGMEKK